MKKVNKKGYIIGGCILSAISFLIIPKLTKTISNKTYQKKEKETEIDFNSMGPEIVKKEK